MLLKMVEVDSQVASSPGPARDKKDVFGWPLAFVGHKTYQHRQEQII